MRRGLGAHRLTHALCSTKCDTNECHLSAQNLPLSTLNKGGVVGASTSAGRIVMPKVEGLNCEICGCDR